MVCFHDVRVATQHIGDNMRSCPRCRGSGKVAEEDDYRDGRDFYRDFHGVAYHRQSTPVHEDVCPECKGRGILRSSGEGKPKTRAEQEIFQDATDDWSLFDWEYDKAFEEFIHKYWDRPNEASSATRDSDAARASIISKARALRRMTVANGATVHEAKTASGMLQKLMRKHGLSANDLDELD